MIEELTKIVLEINSLNGKIPSHLVDPMFELHNNLFPDTKEYNKGCGGCKNRTFGRLLKHYNKKVLNKE